MSLNIWFCDRWNYWNIPETDFMYDKINVATFLILSASNSVTILLNNSALITSLKVSSLVDCKHVKKDLKVNYMT